MIRCRISAINEQVVIVKNVLEETQRQCESGYTGKCKKISKDLYKQVTFLLANNCVIATFVFTSGNNEKEHIYQQMRNVLLYEKYKN